MRDLAPQILRQRHLIEGIYHREVDRELIVAFFDELLERLALRSHAAPTITDSAGIGKPHNQGFEAFLPLIDSGIALYTWRQDRFLSLIVFTCKQFDAEEAVRVTERVFQLDPLEHRSF